MNYKEWDWSLGYALIVRPEPPDRTVPEVLPPRNGCDQGMVDKIKGAFGDVVPMARAGSDAIIWLSRESQRRHTKEESNSRSSFRNVWKRGRSPAVYTDQRYGSYINLKGALLF